MKYVALDEKTSISRIGLGTARFGTKVEEELAFEILDYFYEAGGTVLDTARNYYEWVEDGRGTSERCLGKWMEKTHNREKMIICTKGGVKNSGKIDLSRQVLKEEVKESQEDLRTDHIDMYLLHKDEKERAVEEIVETMQEIREQGKIDILGVANWEYERVERANKYALKHGMEPFRIVQTWWSLAEYTKEMWNDDNTTWMDDRMYQYLKKNDYIAMAYTSQCKGYFQKAIEYGRENVDAFLRHRIETEINLKKLDFVNRYCKKESIKPTAVVCGYITNNPLKGVALVGVSNMQQLKDILDNCDYPLPEQVIQEMNQIN